MGAPRVRVAFLDGLDRGTGEHFGMVEEVRHRSMSPVAGACYTRHMVYGALRKKRLFGMSLAGIWVAVETIAFVAVVAYFVLN